MMDQMTGQPGTLPLSAALGPLLEAMGGGSADVRGALRQIAVEGFQWVQIPATRPGLRSRDLDRSARRDLSATLRRNGLALSGLDLWIPIDHFSDSMHVDRAVAAVSATIEMAGDLGRVAISLALPDDEHLDADVVHQIHAHAEQHGVRVAVHRTSLVPPVGLGIGFDPAVCFWHGGDPTAAVSRIESGHLTSVRLTDVDDQGLRVCPGSGRLDLTAFQGTLVTIGYTAPVILDLRQINMPWACLSTARQAWERSGLSGAAFV